VSSHAAHGESGHYSWGRVRDDGIAVQQAAHIRRPRPATELSTGNERSTTPDYSPVSARAAPTLPTRVRVSGVPIAASSRGIPHQQRRYPPFPSATSLPGPSQTGCKVKPIPAETSEKQAPPHVNSVEPQAKVGLKLHSYVYVKAEGHEVFSFIEAEE
jgi:hypothetical protein